jgi:hypothetical protein
MTRPVVFGTDQVGAHLVTQLVDGGHDVTADDTADDTIATTLDWYRDAAERAVPLDARPSPQPSSSAIDAGTAERHRQRQRQRRRRTVTWRACQWVGQSPVSPPPSSPADAAQTSVGRIPTPFPCRGPLTRWLRRALQCDRATLVHPVAGGDPLVDDDFHHALYQCYELAYRGIPGVDADKEWDPGIVQFRQHLEAAFEAALRDETPIGAVADVASDVDDALASFTGPSLSTFMLAHGTRAQFRTFMIHRSPYQLKEADPHSWALPRLSPGARKSAFVEIQADEYGNGLPGRSHAELFARAMQSAGLDPAYGGYVDQLPGVTLATCNLLAMFGLQRRLTSALLGHLAVFEMTSVEPMSRYAHAAHRLGLGADVARFYEIHVEADDHHGRLAHEVLLGGDLRADGLDPAEVVFGARSLLAVEDRFARHLLAQWATDAPNPAS